MVLFSTLKDILKFSIKDFELSRYYAKLKLLCLVIHNLFKLFFIWHNYLKPAFGMHRRFLFTVIGGEFWKLEDAGCLDAPVVDSVREVEVFSFGEVLEKLDQIVVIWLLFKFQISAVLHIGGKLLRAF